MELPPAAAMDRHGSGRRGGGGAAMLRLTLVAIASPLRAAAVEENCVALSDKLARLNPAFWAPAFVFTSLNVRPGAVHPPNLTRSVGGVQLAGACDKTRFRADSFVWQKPTSDGGDWIASTTAGPLKIVVDGTTCPLTGIAVTSAGWPSLRLQFEQCPRKTALQIPLVKTAEGGLPLVHWMCKVAVDSTLCARAAQKLQSQDPSPASAWPSQLLLDLSLVLTAASKGATRMQIYNECYENLDWYVVNTPIGIPADEFEMLLSVRSLIAPTAPVHSARLDANVVVETVCVPDCRGEVAPQCHARKFVTKAPADHPMSIDVFFETLQDDRLQPWVALFFSIPFLIGSLLSCCLVRLMAWEAKKPERRIKSVALSYHDVPETSTAFFR